MVSLSDLLNSSESSGGNSSSSGEGGDLVCEWDGCQTVFQQAELLYHHLCQDHVGRKSQQNLQLSCHWRECKVRTEKRDHITSHLRVHIPLKPFSCSCCEKRFKRPQDLKKHLKIHVNSGPGAGARKKRGPKSKKDKERELQTQLALQFQRQQLEQQQQQRLPSHAMSNSIPIYNSGSYAAAQKRSAELRMMIPPSLFACSDQGYLNNFTMKLQSVLPPPLTNNYIHGSAMPARQAPAVFFSNLSKDLSQTLSSPYLAPNNPSVNNSTSSSSTPTSATNNSSGSNVTQQSSYGQPILHQNSSASLSNRQPPSLPPLSISPTSSVSSTPSHPRKYPELPHLYSSINGPSSGSATSVSEQSDSLILPPIVNQQYQIQQRQLPSYQVCHQPSFDMSIGSFSSVQKSNGKTDPSNLEKQFQQLSLAPMSLDEHHELLQMVNIIRDYTVCSLLEDYYSDDEDAVSEEDFKNNDDVQDEVNNNINVNSNITNETRSKQKLCTAHFEKLSNGPINLSRYPKIII